ncbi:MAG: LysR family transcriptional regulator [Myxococcota bacterium]
MLDELDWRWMRSFAAVAEAGSMQSAARELRMSQPTLSRHIVALEETLGIKLFARSGRRLALTERGEQLLAHAMDAKRSIEQLVRTSSTLQTEAAGAVRVSMTHFMGSFFAPQWLMALSRDEPTLAVELVLDDRDTDLSDGSAEIALRMHRPTQGDLIARRCGSMEYGFYVSTAFLERYEKPMVLDELLERPLIGFDRFDAWERGARSMGYTIPSECYKLRTDSPEVHARACEAGLGVAVLPDVFVPHLIRVLPEITLKTLDVYVTGYADLRSTPRIDRVWSHLVSTAEGVLNAPATARAS